MKQNLHLEPVSYSALSGWGQDHQALSLRAFALSCEKLSRKSPYDLFGPDAVMGNVADWQAICAQIPDMTGLSEAQADLTARAFFEKWFTPYRMSADGQEDGLFTGYYEPMLHGSLQKSARYNVPLRQRPNDLVMVDLGAFRDELKGQRIAGRVEDGRLYPYEDRAAIEDGKLPAAADRPLMWVSDPVDAFFLQIQGSGLVRLDNGEFVRVGYDGQNGHLYTAIGRELIARGELTKENVSMQSIRAWLAAHPDQARDVMRLNKSYVFFRQLDTSGPVGAQGVVLTPERSLAVDPSFVPYGAPIFIDAEAADKGHDSIRSLVVAQDTGGAIKGPVRGDLFWGHGDRAAHMAGLMASRGRSFILLPK